MKLELHPYSKIKDSLEGLSRKDQYQILLKTVEWTEFRQKVLIRDGEKCKMCNKLGGPIEKEKPYAKWKEEFDRVSEHNLNWEKWFKENPDEFTNQLINANSPDELYLKEIVPSKYIIVGHIHLEVHHKLYFSDKLPWQYPTKYLITLCSNCHRQVHQIETIYTYRDESMKYRKVHKNCQKCGGTGYLPQYDYWYDGICFECGGLVFDPEDSHDWEEIV
jgi:hypothetical protein